MDETVFDALTRSVVTEAGPRRAMVRFLAGTVLGAIASRLTLAEEVKATSHRRKAKRPHQASGHPSHPNQEHSRPHQQKGRGLQSEGKRKGKRKGKGHHTSPQAPPPLPPLPPGCENCNACQMCQDGACVADPALGGVPCEGSGTHCNYCLNGQCIATEDRPCDDGFCPHRGTCCPGEKYCTDHSGPPGYACVGQDDCCPGQKKCGGGCIAQSSCCDADRPSCGTCEAATCDHGGWVCQSTESCGEPCGEGYCPEGTHCHGTLPGVCCTIDTHCQCASGYTGGQGCNGKCCRYGCSGSGCNSRPA